MNTLRTIRSYLLVALVVHVIAVAVAFHTIRVAEDYWSHILAGVPHPDLLRWIFNLGSYLPCLSALVVLAGIFAALRFSESMLMHSVACVMVITVGVLCVAIIGLGLPMSSETRPMDENRANKSVEPTRPPEGARRSP